jgi:hypothetical protein
MDCTDAYREALIRDFSTTASSAVASPPASAPGRRHAAEAEGRPAQRRTDPEPDDLEACGTGG